MELNEQDDGFRVVHVKRKGLIAAWNDTHPDTAIEDGDLVVEVDGQQSGDLHFLLAERVTSKATIALTFSRGISGQEACPLLQSQWVVRVDLSEGKLGVDLDRIAGGLRVHHVKRKGLIAAWNAENPEDVVDVGDRLLSVNGHISGDLESVLAQAASHKSVVELCFVREGTWVVCVDLSKGKLGLELREDAGELLVVNVKRKGLISAWNAENSQRAIGEGDKIVSVNGQSDDLQSLLADAASAKTPVELVLVRCADPVATAADLEETSPNSENWVVIVDLSEGKLGLELNEEDGGLRVIHVKKRGLMAAWNDAHPENAVENNDKIIGVNGQQSDNLHALLAEAASAKTTVELVFVRENEWSVFVNLSEDKLGLDLQPDDSCLRVIKVKKRGLIATWNETHPLSPVAEGDVVVSINGQRSDDLAQLLAVAVSDKSTLQLVLRREA